MGRPLRFLAAAALLGMVTACGWVPVVEPPAEQGALAPDPDAPRLEAVATRRYDSVGPDQELLGELQVVFARHEDTLVDIARHYDLGLEELERANPGVDMWLPGEGTPIFLPTESVIPDVPREGLVLNLPSMRLLYFEPGTGMPESGDPAAPSWSVSSHPVGIGREGWETPLGEATVTSKARDPVWYPPASVRAEHAEMDDPLPAIVPPGPDNPLGRFALGLSMPGYLIHGTNKPPGVGMRVSHGCVRLYPEDIESLFSRVPVGTPVRIVNQPALAGWRDGALFLEVHPPLSEDTGDLGETARRAIADALQRAGRTDADVDPEVVARIVERRDGIPYPVLAGEPAPERYLAAARVVRNDLPAEPEPLAPGL